MSGIKAIVGLGNPGAQYAGTRHNIGFDVVDLIAGGASWRDKGGASLVEHRFEGEKVLLIKPMTYMNRSGEPLQSILGFYKIGLGEVAVVHDEIDLPLGSLRIRKGGGAGGHRGIESVIQCCGGPDFIRFRIGVGRPPIPGIDISDWVLGKFSSEERKAIDGVAKRAIQALEVLVKEGIVKAQLAFNS